jgi:hypothetical protein
MTKVQGLGYKIQGQLDTNFSFPAPSGHLSAAMTQDETHRRRWTFYEAVILERATQ